MSKVAARFLWVGLGAGLAIAGLVGVRALHTSEAAPNVIVNQPAALAPVGAFQPDGMADVAESAVASVVNISSEKMVKDPRQGSPLFSDPFFRQFFGQGFGEVPRERREKSLGSGVVVSADGIVLTNSHVVDGAEDIRVAFADGREFKAKVVGTDPHSDVGVIRIEDKVKNLKPLKFGDDSKLRLGDIVLAVGNPFGVGQTVTMGIVSATGRANVGIVDYEDFIQTDAAINPGNSGGALVDMHGELVGINTAILSRTGGYQGIGFAIPVTMVKGIMDSLLKHGKVLRGWLGVAIQDIDEELADALKLPSNRGVLISDVTGNGPAAKAGLKRGDVVTAVNGSSMDSVGKLRSTIAGKGAKSKVTLDILREGKKKSVEVTLDELPDSLARGMSIQEGEGVLGGLKLGELDNETRRAYQVPPSLTKGVVVVGVEPESPAGQAGFREGDVIVEFNRQRIATPEQFADLYKAARGKILVLVNRSGSTLYLVARKDR